MKSAWMGSGFSHQSVPSLSKVAILAGPGTNESPSSVTDRTKPRIASFAGPGRHEGSGVDDAHRTLPYSRISIAWASRSRSMYGAPLTSTATRRIVPPVKCQGCAPG